jgi:hypothetical protein
MLRIVVAAGLLGSFLAEPTSAFGQGNGVIFGCAGTDMVLVGLKGRSGWWIDGMDPLCVRLKDDGSWIGSIIELSHVGGYGGVGSHDFDLTCPTNFAIAGVSGTRGSYVNSIRITCKPLTTDGHISGAGQDLEHQSDQKGPSTYGPLRCSPADAPAGDILVNAGTWLDSIDQLSCSYPPTYSLASFTVAASLAVGGNAISVTLKLNKAAEAIGGVPITISSTVPSVIASQSVTIATGKTSQTFSLSTHAVGVSTPIQLTARFGSRSLPATVTLIPPLVRPSQ